MNDLTNITEISVKLILIYVLHIGLEGSKKERNDQAIFNGCGLAK